MPDKRRKNRVCSKSKIRERCRQRLRALPASYLREAGDKITDRVLASDAFRNAKVLFCYVSVLPEPDTRRLIEEALRSGKTVCVPYCRTAAQMDAVRILDLSELKPGAYGIPAPGEESGPFEKERIDLCIVPCLSAGRDGTRLGHGGGYYDRFLADVKAPKICLCYRELLTEDLPAEETDIRMDAVVTD